MHDVRAEVMKFYRPDVIALVETWLKGEEGGRDCGGRLQVVWL